MSVISKKFATELNEKEMRDAYLDAQTRAKLALQIRTLRAQRGLSQEAFGALMGKPQANVARLEDRNVGRYTLTTLLECASAFDVGLIAKFVPYEDFLSDTSDLAPETLKVHSFNPEALASLYSDDAADWYFNSNVNAATVIYPLNMPVTPWVSAAPPSNSFVVNSNSLALNVVAPLAAISVVRKDQKTDERVAKLQQQVQDLKMQLAKCHRDNAALQANYDALLSWQQTTENDAVPSSAQAQQIGSVQ